MGAIVQSVGALADVLNEWQYPISRRSLQFYDQYNYDYATLYRTQPNVRTCVDFLARNVAQLGLHVFRRVSETDRVRLRDHGLARTLERPLPPEFKVTRYRLVESLMGDLGVYFNAFWLKVKQGDSLALLRVPPTMVEVKGGLVPTGYEVNLGLRVLKVSPDEMVHFRGYNAENPIAGLSPLETLRRVLAEEQASGDYREHYWKNAARINGVIERPAEAGEWSEVARERFKADFAELYSGGENSGKTAVLEDGMTWRAATFNPAESEYLSGRKLTREECARAYHIPLPMVGILDHATFSNIREQHKNLYQDSLGPWLAMIEQDVELQLLPEFEDSEGVYVEFNIQEKLQGSFEEQVQALQSAVGRPWMTPDEARARMNMRSLGEDAAQLATPLNVLIGGQASPRDSGPKTLTASTPGAKGLGEIDPTLPDLRERHREQWARLMARTFERQRSAIMSRLKGLQTASKGYPDFEVLWDAERWNRELGADFYRMSTETAKEFGQYVADELEIEFDVDRMLPFLEENARITAEYVNGATAEQVEDALRAEDVPLALTGVFELALGVRASSIATGRVTMTANFGAREGARQGGLKTKTWRVNSSNPRESHAALNGMTIGIEDVFPNGLRWPGDPQGSAEESANCQCSLIFGR